jgi:hypothetical protein
MSSSSSDSSDEEIFIYAMRSTIEFMIDHAKSNTECPPPVRRRIQIMRDREAANQRLINDYFSETSLYTDKQFKRRFRMSRRLFLKIVKDMDSNLIYFQQKSDARGKLGFTPLQKCTSAMRQLAYGSTADSWDEYLKVSDKTSRDTLCEFFRGMF